MLLLIVVAIISVCLLFLVTIKGRRSGYATDFDNYQNQKVKEFMESEVNDVVS